MVNDEDCMKYFQRLPIIKYPIKYNSINEANQGKDLLEYATTVDLNVRYSVLSTVLTNPFATYDYVVEDGDTPHSIAHMYYGNQYYFWLVLMSAQIFDWAHEWPMNSDELETYIYEKYNMTFEESLTEIHHYEDSDGYIIDELTWFNTPVPKYAISVYDYEHEQNELKRNIKLISKNYVGEIENEFDAIIKSINDTVEINKV